MSALASVATGSALDKNNNPGTNNPTSTTSQTITPGSSTERVTATTNPVSVPERDVRTRSQSSTPPVDNKSPSRANNNLRLSTEMSPPVQPIEVSDQFLPGKTPLLCPF